MNFLASSPVDFTSPAAVWVAGFLGVLASLVIVLWAVYLMKEIFGRRPSLADELKTLATKAELSALSDKFDAQVRDQREDGDARAERMRRIEDTLGQQSSAITAVQTTAGHIHSMVVLMNARLEATADKAATAMANSKH